MGEGAEVIPQCGELAIANQRGQRLKGYAQLAGVHKVALPLPRLDSPDFLEAITFPESNFNFSLSLYCFKGDREAEYEELAADLVATLREAGHKKANLVRPRSGQELFSERVAARSAMDFVAFPMGAAMQWGVTVYTPDTEAFKERSTQRPYVTSGISLSSRLARLLVNLSGVTKGQVLLDPFCGSGTILGEALLKGLECVGVDRNHGSVERTKDNLEWVAKSAAGDGRKIPPHSVLVGDATQLRKTIGDRKVDAIVTEPILIPKLSAPPSLENARRLVRHASAIYSEALHEMSGVLRQGGRMVLVTPSIRTIDGKDVSLLLEDIRDIGLRPFQPDRNSAYEYPLSVLHQSTRWVRRMVYVLERT